MAIEQRARHRRNTQAPLPSCAGARPAKGVGVRPLTTAGASESQRDIGDPCRFRLLLRSTAILAVNWCSSMTSTPTRSGMSGHFGIRVVDANKEKLVGELDADDRHLNNSGHVHGGALAAFADHLGGALAGLNVSPGFRTSTIESKTNIFRACVPERLTGVAIPIHVRRRTIVLQTSIYRADGKLAAMIIQIQMVLPRGSATPADEGGDEV
jgi:1,4-dihydroxy-2-naphthoyl-CoA hydrolase